MALNPKEFKYMSTCTKCLLHKNRTNVVIGRPMIGNVSAFTFKYMFIGEAPGAEEDTSGLPFVGKSGQLLESLIKQSGLETRDIYITNIVKCRPEGNRKPSGTEIHTCSKHLEFQIAFIKPKLIVTVGATPLSYFRANDKITSVHGKLLDTRSGRKIFPILHPAAALRNPDYIDLIKEDLAKLSKLDFNPTHTVTFGPRIINKI